MPDRVPSAEEMIGFSAAVNRLLEQQSEALVASQRTLREALEAERRRFLVVLVALGVFLAALGVAVVTLLGVSAGNRELLDAVNRSSDRLIDCTTTNGKCAQAGRERTARIVQRLIDTERADTERIIRCVRDPRRVECR